MSNTKVTDTKTRTISATIGMIALSFLAFQFSSVLCGIGAVILFLFLVDYLND